MPSLPKAIPGTTREAAVSVTTLNESTKQLVESQFGQFWIKGETSGHVQVVKDVAFDCDGDTLLIQVEQTGAACHEGYKSCFFRSVQERGEAFAIKEPQLVKPEQVYGKK